MENIIYSINTKSYISGLMLIKFDNKICKDNDIDISYICRWVKWFNIINNKVLFDFTSDHNAILGYNIVKHRFFKSLKKILTHFYESYLPCLIKQKLTDILNGINDERLNMQKYFANKKIAIKYIKKLLKRYKQYIKLYENPNFNGYKHYLSLKTFEKIIKVIDPNIADMPISNSSSNTQIDYISRLKLFYIQSMNIIKNDHMNYVFFDISNSKKFIEYTINKLMIYSNTKKDPKLDKYPVTFTFSDLLKKHL